MRYRLLAKGVLNVDTGETILPRTAAWNTYLEWVRRGGTVEPQDPPPALSEAEVSARAELSARAALRNNLRAMTVIQQLRGRSPADIDNWIQTNVTDLASAKVVLRILAYVVAYLAREWLS
jgi:hypothetical protein